MHAIICTNQMTKIYEWIQWVTDRINKLELFRAHIPCADICTDEIVYKTYLSSRVERVKSMAVPE